MVDWHSKETLTKNERYAQIVFAVCFGIYVWEFLLTAKLELSIYTRRIPFKWPYVFYLGGRYCAITTVVALLSMADISHRLDCGLSYKLLSLLGNSMVGCATTNLAIRPFMLWQDNRYVRPCLVCLSIGHWVFLWTNSLNNIRASWNADLSLCLVHYHEHEVFAGLYIYTMLYDLIVIVLTAVGMCRQRLTNSPLYARLWHQGLAYFVVTTCVNVIPCVIIFINLNPIIDMLVAIPAALVSIIASSRAVSSLRNAPSEQLSTSVQMSTMIQDSQARSHSSTGYHGAKCFPMKAPAQDLGEPTQFSTHVSLTIDHSII